MKKFLLTIALVVCSFALQAQVFVSLNAGGSIHSGNTHTVHKIAIATDSLVTTDVPLDKSSSFQVGLRAGYKIGDVTFGIGANYGTGSVTVQGLDASLMPLPGVYNLVSGSSIARLRGKIEGEMTTKTTTISVTPFVRYNYLKAGDIALFVELNGIYTMMQDPQVTATRQFKVTDVPQILPMTDTTFTIGHNSKGLGVRIIPGMSWRFNKYISLDLYFDFLSLAYTSLTTTTTSHNYTYEYNADGMVIKNILDEQTTITTTTTDIDLGIFGNPDWSLDTPRNFVRVGINFSF